MRAKSTPLPAKLATPIALVLIGVVGFICGVFPLTGTPGYEAAQILGVTGGPLLMLAAATRGARRTDNGFIGDFFIQGAMSMLGMALFVGIITLTSVGHESCAPGRGHLPFVFFSFPVLFLHTAVGLWLGRVTGNLRVAIAACVVLLGGGVAWLVAEWLVDPSFRVLSHLFVVVDGDLMRGRPITGAQVGFRAATFFYASALTFAGIAQFPKSRKGGLSSGATSSTTALIVAVVFVALGGVTHFIASDAISPGRSALDEAYSFTKKRGRLVVHADPRHHTVDDVDAILAEGALWMHRLTTRLGVKPSEDIHIYLHKDRRTLGHYTGAEHVHFALPFKRELHISGAEVPHRSLGHELAHVMGGEFSDSMMGVPSKFIFIINTGLVEGLAMAVTPELEVDHGLTLEEKAAALAQNDMTTPPQQLFSPWSSFFYFWSQNTGNSYTSAGALVHALLAEKGPEGLRKAYAANDVNAAFDDAGQAKAFFDKHQARLSKMPLPDDAKATVARRFQRPSILRETCNAELRTAKDEVTALAHQGKFDAAEQRLRDVAQPPGGDDLGLLLKAAERLHDDERVAHYALARTRAQDEPSTQEQARRLNRAADALWTLARHREAAVLWGRVEATHLPPALQRLLWAKRTFADEVLARGGRAPVAMAAMHFLVPKPGADVVANIAKLSEAVEHARKHRIEGSRSVELARYLLARQYGARGLYDESVVSYLETLSDGTVRFPEAFKEQVLLGIALGHARRGDTGIGVAGLTQVAEAAKRSSMRVRVRDDLERTQRMQAARKASPSDETYGDRWLLGRPKASK